VFAVNIGEIQTGIEISRKQDAVKGKEIELWLDGVEQSYRVLPLQRATERADDPVPHPEWTAPLDREKDALTEFGARGGEKITSRRDCVIAVKGRESDRKREARGSAVDRRTIHGRRRQPLCDLPGGLSVGTSEDERKPFYPMPRQDIRIPRRGK